MNTTDIGKIGENYATKFLKKNGYRIIQRNVHQSHNEIDIIACNKEYIVFVEVKARSVNEIDEEMPYGTPASAVTKGKQSRTIIAANRYLGSSKGSKFANKQPRIDVIEIYLNKLDHKLISLNHIINAFGVN